MYKVFREFVIAYIRTVLDVEGGKDFPVFCYYLGGKLAFRILQFFKRRYVCKGPY